MPVRDLRTAIDVEGSEIVVETMMETLGHATISDVKCFAVQDAVTLLETRIPAGRIFVADVPPQAVSVMTLTVVR